ncbi:MAG TPA: hypothetical protein VMI54_17635 [Polyangiaceae bacterium]|nr:hypothetical protein [Polyangiaceae bacterium]
MSRRALTSSATLTFVLLGAGGASFGCGGKASSRAGHATDGSDAGRRDDESGGEGAGMRGVAGSSAGGRGGASAGAQGEGARSGTGGLGDTAGASAGAPSAGFGGRATATAGDSSSGGSPAQGGTLASGGSGGDSPQSAGESAGGAGGATECRDLCSEAAPACCSASLTCVSATPHCRLDVLAGRVAASAEYADLELSIGMLTGDVLTSITDADVGSAAAEPPAAARFEFDLTADASSAYGSQLVADLGQPFRVSCDDEPLFDGLIYFRGGEALLHIPVLHVEQAKDGSITLMLGANEAAWGGMEAYYPATDDERARIDRPELRAAFCARGILSELPVPTE